jgi:hypothetical protein
MDGRAITAGTMVLNSPGCARSSVRRDLAVRPSCVITQRGERMSVDRKVATRIGDMI